MISLGVKNFRNLKDTGKIEIKPLNFLLGANSSGKSSFLRIFPLLRQSIEVTTKGPILWYGDYVDFGDFHTAVRNGEKDIIFKFEFKISADERYRGYYGRDFLFTDTNILLDMHIKESNETSYIDTIVVAFDDQTVVIKYSKENKIVNIELNSDDFSKGSENLYIPPQGKGIIPRIYSQSIADKKTIATAGTESFFQDRLFSFIKARLRTGTSIAATKKIINIKITGKRNILKQIRKSDLPITWLKNIVHWNLNAPDFKQFNNLLLGFRLGNIIDSLNEEMLRNFEDIHYVAPLRAIAERYYRRQNLSVAEVDYQGKNLPMFINNMSPVVLQKFQEWVESFFKFYPQTSTSEGHISLKLIDRKSGESFNITDRGFGYSQLLPIITMIWSIINTAPKTRYWNSGSNERSIVIAIEQPELHLHPALQTRMIDVFSSSVNLAREKNISLKFIIETHSETMINYIGHQVANKKITPESVNILVFGSGNNSKDDIVISEYDDNGHLKNWPFGFFDPEY